MMKGNTSDFYLDLANDLFPFGWFNPDRLKADAPLFIVEDFYDALPIDDSGGAAVFFHNLDDETELRRFKPLFDDFSKAFILVADKAMREELSELLSRLFPNLAQFIPKDDAFKGYTKLRDLIDGVENALDGLIVSAIQKPAYGLINLSKVAKSARERIALSGIRGLDREINGFGAGELSVWTGTRGSGKSTLISQLLLNAVNQGVNVFAYSGELTQATFFASVVEQAAGGKHTRMEIDPHSGKEYYTVDAQTEAKIREWLDGKFFLYDNTIADANNAESILAIMGLAANRYGCKVFLCDNLMTARFSRNDRDFYRDQSEFVGHLVEFSKANNVHVHLVAHPRKAGDGNLIADDVGGSGDITNRADNVFSIKRIVEDGADFDAGLTILKNRYYGALGVKVKLCFDKTCNRFSEAGYTTDWRYGWETSKVDFSNISDVPF